ncbi:MAG: hypothetical protein SNJ67_03375 [Chloracidobacterium sp.]
MRACHARPREEVPDAAAWLEVRDERAGAGAPLGGGQAASGGGCR